MGVALAFPYFIPSTAGVLNESDSDHETANALGVEIAAERPFSAITHQSRQAAEALMADAHYVLVAAVPFGTGNLANLELAELAQSRGSRVVLLGAEDITGRDYTGGLATSAFQRMLAQGASSFTTVEAWMASAVTNSGNVAAQSGQRGAEVGNSL